MQAYNFNLHFAATFYLVSVAMMVNNPAIVGEVGHGHLLDLHHVGGHDGVHETTESTS